MKISNKWLLLLPYSLYLYVLLKVILFKFGSVDISVLWRQLHRATEILNMHRIDCNLPISRLLNPFE